MRKFDKAEALDAVYASDEEYEEIEPTHDVESEAYTKRSVEE